MPIIPSFAYELLIIFSAASVMVVLFHYLRQPAIAGFLLSGVLVGPSGLNLITDHHRIEAIADVGIILLLFSLGVEFSIKRLRDMGRAFFGLGSSQCILTTIIVGSALLVSGLELIPAAVIGAIVALSSTAVVLKLLQQRRETTTPHGRVTVAVALFQDLWVVPLMIIIPWLGDVSSTSNHSFAQIVAFIILKMVALAATVIIASRYVVPRVLATIAATGIRELFMIVVALIAFGTAFFTAQLGLSLALGAFVAGVMISDSDYGHQAVADVVPLRDPFMALFFVAVGMLVDLNFVLERPLLILGLSVVAFACKGSATFVAAWLLRYPMRLCISVALALAQVGEFGFVLARMAREHSVIVDTQYQLLLAVTILLMCVSPLMLKLAPKISPAWGSLGVLPDSFRKLGRARKDTEMLEVDEDLPVHNHAVVIGYGHNGKALTGALQSADLPCTVVEINLEAVREAQRNGLSATFGDAARREILEAAGIERARMLVICISDPVFITQIVATARALRPEIYILVRSHYVNDIEKLEAVGATDLVVGEIETGYELLSRVLQHFGLPHELIERSLEQAHHEKYRSMRQLIRRGELPQNLPGWIESFEFLPILVPPESMLIGTPLSQSGLRERTGALIVGVFRTGMGYSVPDGDFSPQAGDVLYAVGEPEAVELLGKIAQARA